MTVNERIASLAAASGVISAFQEGNTKSIGTLDLVPVTWVHVSGSVARRGGGTLIVANYQEEGETAYWGGEIPSVLVPPPSAQGYITDRNTPFTEAQVIEYANTKWRTLHANAPDILGIELDNLDGKSVKVSGLFWTGVGARSPLKYVIRFVDPNGDVNDANVKLELIS